MKYKAYFNFAVKEDEVVTVKNTNLAVAMFQVDGGASRMIKIDSTDDLGLVSDLKDAQNFKNIILYLSSTKDHRDMKAALDLTKIAGEEMGFIMHFVIERFSGGRMLEGLTLASVAYLNFAPQIGVDNKLVVTIELDDDSRLVQGKIKDHFMKGGLSKGKAL